jgi:MFS transporter, DHA2 family, multidrug resistance protein
MTAEPHKLSLQSKLIIVTAVMASLLEIIDTSIVNVAIPSMMGNLGATLEDISWVVTGYIIANAIVLPASSWLGSQIGRRVYYVSCILLFTGTSVLCGIAPNLFWLSLFRVFQGLAGGALLPTSQALIQEQFPREKAGMASAIYGMSVMIGPTLGPTLGGYLTDNFGWRSIFNINLPLGLIAAAMALRTVTDLPKKSSPGKKSQIDGVGLMLLTIGIGCLQYVLERGQADDWFDSTAICLCTFLAVVSIPGFIWWELRQESPIVNLRLFKESAIRNGTLLMLSVGLMLYGLMFVLPVFVGRQLHYDATQTGMLFIPGALLTAFCMPITGNLLKRFSPRPLILFGILVVEVCLTMIGSFSSLTGTDEVFWAMLVRGLGMAFLFVPINSAVLGSFRGEELGQAAGLLNLSRQLGGSIGIALIATLLSSVGQQYHNDLASHVSPLNPMVQQTLRGANQSMKNKMENEVGFWSPRSSAAKMIEGRVSNQVFILSFDHVIFVLKICFGLSLIPLLLLKIKGYDPKSVDLGGH